MREITHHIEKYGHLRLEYLKKFKKADYTIMFMDGTLRKHIVDTNSLRIFFLIFRLFVFD